MLLVRREREREKMKPPTPNLDVVLDELSKLLNWWLNDGIWWHQPLLAFIIVCLLMVIAGGLRANFMGINNKMGEGK